MKTGQRMRFILLVFLLLCGGAYLGIACYYMDGFSAGTWINGLYCTGKNVEEVNRELLSQAETPELTVVYPICCGTELEEAERKSSRFVLGDGTAKMDYSRALQRLLQKQRPLLWARNLFLPAGGYELQPDIVWAQGGMEQFEKQFLADAAIQAEINREACIRMESGEENSLCLYNGKKNRLDVERAFLECVHAVETGEKQIVLSKDCYYDEEPNESEKEQERLYLELQEFLNFEIVYDMGAEQVRFDQKALVGLLRTAAEQGQENGELVLFRNEEGKFCWDEAKVEQAIEKLADTYNTYGKPRRFSMTGGGEITLEKGNYGTELDKKTEIKWLMEALEAGKSEVHRPAYRREAYARGENDIGDTYIEINMTKQKLWFYQDGKAEIETPIVTGNMMRRRGTPEGVYYVYGKQKNRILRGPGYASYVNYWMPVKGGVGIHDALWRDEFGGDIYKKEGSHGCINLPLEAAEKLYGMIEIGVPVVMYYEEE